MNVKPERPPPSFVLPARPPRALVFSEIQRNELRLLERNDASDTARTTPWLRPVRPVLGRR